MSRERDEFFLTMAREYPDANLLDLRDTLAKLCKLSKYHASLQELACNEPVPEGHDEKCEAAIRKVCEALPGCEPIFSGDPRGCTVRLRVPSGRTNDWARTGICVPQ
jgi:hypothetical protein